MGKKIMILLLCLLFFFTCSNKKSTPAVIPQPAQTDSKTYQVLHIMSYHSPWKWTDDQLAGFKAALTGLNVEYQVFELNQKYATAEKLSESIRLVKRSIDTSQPDLVYTTDDFVQDSVVKEYVNSGLPFVFSGVNMPPETYGFAGSKNVTGVLEHELFIPVVNLLKKIIPGFKTMAIITDNDVMWPGMVARMQDKAATQLKDIRIIGWDLISTYAGYQQQIAYYQDKVDAIGLLGVFLFKDEKGENVPFEQVLQWTVENSNVPDFSFWADRIPKGTLCAVTVSGYEQGLAAGRIARAILVDKRSPDSFAFESTAKGEPVINLARAGKLGLKIDSDILLTAEIVNKFEW